MAHFAKIGLNNKVISVIKIDDTFIINGNGVEDEVTGVAYLEKLTLWPLWVQTSFNTRHGKYYNIDGSLSINQTKAFRKNFASSGMTYDENRNAFIPEKKNIPPNFILDEESCTYVAPIDFESSIPEGQKWCWDGQIWVKKSFDGYLPNGKKKYIIINS